MAYLVVVGGGNAGAEYSNGNKYEGAKIDCARIPNENSTH
jgi:hypothetical protein